MPKLAWRLGELLDDLQALPYLQVSREEAQAMETCEYAGVDLHARQSGKRKRFDDTDE